MKSAFWLFIGLFLGFGLSYVAYLKAEQGPRFAQAADDAEVDAMRDAADRLAQRQQPRDNEEKKLKSKFGRFLMDLFDGVQGASDEERQLVEDTLRENDEILHEVLEEDLSAKIRAANNRHGRPRGGVILPPPVERQPRNFVERPEQASTERAQDGDTTPVVDPADAI